MSSTTRVISTTDPNFLNNIPDTLYKYRCWNNTYHKRMLTETEIYFASANSFNDPYDCSLPYKWKQDELTEENIFNKYRTSLKEMHPNWTETQIHESCYFEQQQGLFHDETHIKSISEDWRRKEYKAFGIVSLTSQSNNFLMWSHYADSHNGFAVGFDKYILFEVSKASLSPMIYQKEIPSYGLFEDLMEKSMKQLHTKSDVWEYEDEYRLISMQRVNSSLKLPIESVKQIVLGLRMDFKVKAEIINLAETKYPDALVHEVHLNEDEFKLDLFQIR